MRPRYIILHAPAFQWFILDRQSRSIVASGLETREAAEAYVAAVLTPEPVLPAWTVVRDDEGIPVRLER
jgi:hypothetical protein